MWRISDLSIEYRLSCCGVLWYGQRLLSKFILGLEMRGGGALCVEMGFTRTSQRHQDATMKLKSDLNSNKF